MMKVVWRITEAEIFRAERNTFQYVTDVVISSEKVQTQTNMHQGLGGKNGSKMIDFVSRGA